MKKYSYVIIKENYPELEKQSTLLHNKYNSKKRYAFINKISHEDGSENIAFIDYSNDLQELQNRASEFVSWFNYPIGVAKGTRGELIEI